MRKLGEWSIPDSDEVMEWAFGPGWDERKLDDCFSYFTKKHPDISQQLRDEWAVEPKPIIGGKVIVQFVLDNIERCYTEQA